SSSAVRARLSEPVTRSGGNGHAERRSRPGIRLAGLGVGRPLELARLPALLEHGSLGGLGGTGLVAGVRWVVRGMDAGSVRIRWIRARLRTSHRDAQRAPAARRP